MFTIRIIMMAAWLLISSILGLLMSLFRWGDVTLNRDFAHLLGWGGLKIAGVKLDVQGLEDLEKTQPCVYVANHQSGLDIFVFGRIFPVRCIVIAKKELRWIPFFNLFFVSARNIFIDRYRRAKAVAGLAQATEGIKKRGLSIWLFPEGTRNRTGVGFLPFKKGAFYMAIEAGVPVVPVVSAPLSTVFNVAERRFTGGTLKIKVLPPISTAGMTIAQVDSLSAQVRDKMLVALHGFSGDLSGI